MKKLLAIILSVAIALSLAACGGEAGKPISGDPTTNEPDSKSNVGVPIPFVDCDTLAEAEKQAGFAIVLPNAIDGYDSKKISIIPNELISVIFSNSDDGQICFRKGVGDQDVSGNFTEYPETEQVDVDGVEVTMKGSDSKVNLAVWGKDGYAYSISGTDGLGKVTMTDLVLTMSSDMVIGGDPATWGPGDQSDVEIPNPFTDCDTLADAAREAGFDLVVPEEVNGAADRLIRVMDSEMIEVIYQAGAGETVRIRKAPGTKDISGDFNEYAQTNAITIGEVEVTMCGDDGLVNLAIWTADGYTYSVSVTDGISSSEMAELVAGIH